MATYKVQVKERTGWKVVGTYSDKASALATKAWHVTMGREARVMVTKK